MRAMPEWLTGVGGATCSNPAGPGSASPLPTSPTKGEVLIEFVARSAQIHRRTPTPSVGRVGEGAESRDIAVGVLSRLRGRGTIRRMVEGGATASMLMPFFPMAMPMPLVHMLMRLDHPSIRLPHPPVRQMRMVVMVLIDRQRRRRPGPE
jgi:hypothetical protein